MLWGWVWLMAVLIHLLWFREAAPKGFIATLFDQLVMFSCFLLYPIRELMPLSGVTQLIPFLVQFVFWWTLGLGFHSLIHKFRKKT